MALVQVKTAVHPNLPDGLSAEESARIRKRAVRMRWEAWLAQVHVDDTGALLGPLVYTRLIWPAPSSRPPIVPDGATPKSILT